MLTYPKIAGITEAEPFSYNIKVLTNIPKL